MVATHSTCFQLNLFGAELPSLPENVKGISSLNSLIFQGQAKLQILKNLFKFSSGNWLILEKAWDLNNNVIHQQSLHQCRSKCIQALTEPLPTWPRRTLAQPLLSSLLQLESLISFSYQLPSVDRSVTWGCQLYPLFTLYGTQLTRIYKLLIMTFSKKNFYYQRFLKKHNVGM